jgi:bilirubin oxidase
LDAPVALSRLRLAPGERAEILVDFSGKIGQTINLMSFASELPSAIYGASQPGMGAGQTIPGYTSNSLNGTNFKIISFSVTAQSTSPIVTIPSSLTINSPYNSASANAFKNLTFTPVNMGPTAIQGPFLINNTTFDMDVINYTIPFNNIEIWTLTNQTPIAHPFHIHDVQFYITEINGAAPPANMKGRKDVVLVPGGGQTVKFIAKFETFCDSMASYMYHCHMLTHEDDGMMGQFVVKCPNNVGLTENDYSTNNFLVYSNHTDKNIHIKSNQIISEVKLIDISGKIIFDSDKISSTEFIIENKNQAGGIYFIDLKIANKIYHKKVMLFD